MRLLSVLILACCLQQATLQAQDKEKDSMFKKPTQSEMKKKLSPLQYEVTQKNGTEKPFQNEYWNNERAGIYVDVVTGEPLFSSLEKYDSGTGWPSFYDTLHKDAVVAREDKSLFRERLEIRSKVGNSHLGHVFDDGPADKTGKRYCMNSAALRFVPVEDLEKEGYAQYVALFKDSEKLQSQPQRVVFAAGCFWCVEDYFLKVPGVLKVTSGYSGGFVENPTYEQVSGGKTGHREAVEIEFDPKQITFQQLMERYWSQMDPQNKEGQFCDTGFQYQSAVYYTSEEQKQIAEATKAAVAKRYPEVSTPVVPAQKFWPAEEYHQRYSEKNPVRYKLYKVSCGRERRLEQVWGPKTEKKGAP